jgi:uncharacterized membrane protein
MEALLVKDVYLRNSTIALSVLGIIDSLYLLYIKISHATVVCSGGCDIVNASKYSEMFGIPIAIFGVLGYLVILLIVLLDNKFEFIKENSTIVIFGFSLIGVLCSAYLTYLEIEVIHAICEYCVISAVAMTLIFIISIFRLNTAE